ncbi:glycosyltransferase family 39 protein [Chelatococcus sp. SYSU_G07232]|uniref:Glycosyltransferase family 39 protein n=2 Tax=Chelatococcus albus TaxID=3047466 RepID=A0ABT7ACD3_9HYPH|nr:glycosyltransferase family 39 protein [Chelatococcus sp. SYSU_G07232]MDJ1157037.1 glycosyltransferase family 39 protein [Chelatococcus sp. SYSU_G07232]
MRGFSGRCLAFVEASHARALAILLLLSLAAFLPGFASLQPMDRDEPRFAQASKQMLETGDFVDIRFQDEARHKKPVGIYWLQSATVAAAEALGVPEARTTIALYRLPSLAGALAMVLLTYWAALGVVGRRAAFLAAAFMGASILLGVEARLAKTDAFLSACSVTVMGGLARVYLRREAQPGPVTLLAFWGAMAIAILIKGPIAPMIAGLAALVLSVRERSGRWLLALRPGLGLVVVLLVVLPWFVAIALKTGGAFFEEAVGRDMLAKVGSGQEKHWGPPGLYLLVFFGTFWPVAALAAIAIPFVWRTRREPWVAFCLAWLVPSWLVFEAVPTKLPHYVLPLYPAVAMLTAGALMAGAISRQRPGASLVALLIPFIPVGLAAGLAGFALKFDGTLPYVALPAFAVAVGFAVWGWSAFRRDDAIGTALLGCVASVALSVAVFGLTQPVLRSLQLSPRLAAVARALDCASPAFVTSGYREPSLVFLVGTELVMEDGAGAARFLGQGGCRMAFVERREEGAFAAQAAGAGLAPTLVTRVPGFNINGGRALDIAVYAVKP